GVTRPLPTGGRAVSDVDDHRSSTLTERAWRPGTRARTRCPPSGYQSFRKHDSAGWKVKPRCSTGLCAVNGTFLNFPKIQGDAVTLWDRLPWRGHRAIQREVRKRHRDIVRHPHAQGGEGAGHRWPVGGV